MATFVIVHGAWSGPHAWRWVRPLLRAAGHEVVTPSLTGLGERAHLATPMTDLDTHVTDVAAVLHFEDLWDVVLVGHSYGGMVITGVADRARPSTVAARPVRDLGRTCENPPDLGRVSGRWWASPARCPARPPTAGGAACATAPVATARQRSSTGRRPASG